jgi:hypothetical protein
LTTIGQTVSILDDPEALTDSGKRTPPVPGVT